MIISNHRRRRDANVGRPSRIALDRDQCVDELAVAPPVAVLSRFVETELPRLEALNEPEDAAGEVEELNGFFRRYALTA